MDKGKIPGREWVYVLADEHGRVKIGIAEDLNKRRSQFKTHNPDELRVVFDQSCPLSKARSIERYAHDVLASTKKHGEWFNDTPDNAKRAVMRGMKKRGQLYYPTQAWKGQFSMWSHHAGKCLYDQSLDEIRDSLEPGDEDRVGGIPLHYTFKKSRHSSDYSLTVTYYPGLREPRVDGTMGHDVKTITKRFEQAFTASSAFEYVEDIFAKYPDPRMQEV